MSARGVRSSSPPALQRHVTYRNDWKLELAVQKVRGVNMTLSLCLIFWNTQETTFIVTTRGAISLNLQQNWVPGRHAPFLICCVAWTRSFLPTARRRIAVRRANARGMGRGRRRKTRSKLWRGSRLSWRSRSSRTRTGLHPSTNTATWRPRSTQPTKSSEPASRMLPERSRTSCLPR